MSEAIDDGVDDGAVASCVVLFYSSFPELDDRIFADGYMKPLVNVHQSNNSWRLWKSCREMEWASHDRASVHRTKRSSSKVSQNWGLGSRECYVLIVLYQIHRWRKAIMTLEIRRCEL